LAKSLNVDTIDLRPAFQSPFNEINEVFMASTEELKETLEKIFIIRDKIGDMLEIKLLPLWFEFLLSNYDKKPIRRFKCGRGYLHIEPNCNLKTCGP